MQDEDDRLIKMLADLDRRYTGDDYSVNKDADLVNLRPTAYSNHPKTRLQRGSEYRTGLLI